MKKKPLCLIIRDGWGKGKEEETNAIYIAQTPFADRIEREYPTSLIKTSGESVGLPAGYQGNSEVGHINIGAGRIIYQSLTRIDRSIKTGEFFKNETINQVLNQTKSKSSTVHLIGLIQEEGIHAVTRHCLAFLRMCKEKGIGQILIHGISDGRDTPPTSAKEHFDFLNRGIKEIGVGRIASITGRYYAMDRDNRWERIEIFYRCLMEGIGTKAKNYIEAIDTSYQKDETDEFIKPYVFNYQGIKKDDLIIFFNFRFDRTRQITKSIVEPDFNKFSVLKHNLTFLAMTHYYDNGNFLEVFPLIKHKNLLGAVLANNGLKQLRCSETEKYAHITFFLNGLNNKPFKNEDRILVKSPSVATYDLKPEMSAEKIKKEIIKALLKDKYDVIICNFANCDMVGHTGKYSSIIKAVETVDECCAELTETILDLDGTVIITADHGNAEQTKLSNGDAMTSHTKNPVPLSIVSNHTYTLTKQGKLCDIAPTILELLHLRQPRNMTGRSLLIT